MTTPPGATEAREAIRLEPANPLACDQLFWNTGHEQLPEAEESEKTAREEMLLHPSSQLLNTTWGVYCFFKGATKKRLWLSIALQRMVATPTRTSVWRSSRWPKVATTWLSATW